MHINGIPGMKRKKVPATVSVSTYKDGGQEPMTKIMIWDVSDDSSNITMSIDMTMDEAKELHAALGRAFNRSSLL